MRPLRTLGATVSLVAIMACTACGPPTPQAEAVGTAVPRTNAPEHLDAPYVVLVSLDGFRADYLDRYPTPALQRMIREGARARAMIPAFPSKTFPAHYTIATGLYSENHGLVGNTFWAPDMGAAYSTSNRAIVEDGAWYRGEPIWVTAERQGMLTAAFYFVGTEADVGGVRPTYWRRYDGTIDNAQRVDTVLGWLGLAPEARPHLIAMYFSDLDDVGHDFGPDSPEVGAAMSDVDEQVGRLLDGIAALPHGDDVYVVLVSDHGMARAEADRAQPLDVRLFPGVRMMESGPYASLVVDVGGPGRLAGLRDSIQALLPEATVWLREDVPERLRYSSDPRVGDLVVLAESGATIVRPNRVPTADDFTHGWDNRDPDMAALFLARGPGIAGAQVIEPFESVNVYPFLAHVLGLDPAPTDGRLEVLAPILHAGKR